MQKCRFFVKSDATKPPKPLKTPGFRVLADASKLTTLANKKEGTQSGAFFFVAARGVCTQNFCFLKRHKPAQYVNNL